MTDGISDLQFTDAYRVPFQYGGVVRQHLKSPAFVQSSAGVMLADLDGNRFYDLTGSYGVNVLGYDFYKRAIARAVERVGELGPVLGPYHPVVADNVRRHAARTSELALERARLAEEAQRVHAEVQNTRLRNALLSSVSHDLRTPLAVTEVLLVRSASSSPRSARYLALRPARRPPAS